MRLPDLSRVGLAVKVGAALALSLAFLGVILAFALTSQLWATERSDARDAAVAVRGGFDEDDLARAARVGPGPELRERLGRAARSPRVERVRLVSATGEVAYSSDGMHRGQTLSPGALAEAREGSADADRKSLVTPRGERRKVVEAVVPLTTGGSTASGAMVVDYAEGPIAARVAHQRGRLLLVVLGAALFLGLCLQAVIIRASRRLTHQARATEAAAQRDGLTGLPNRVLFNRLVEDAVKACPPSQMVAVLLMDLDRFKEINDTLGHFNGDRVIERVGERLQTVLREGDSVARLGGDEFAMLLPGVQNRDAVVSTAKRVHRALEEPFTAGGLTLKVEASIGIALAPEHGNQAGNLLRAADVAMYAAKKGHTGHEIFGPHQQRYSPARLGLVAQLKRAMDQGELELHYQPKARLETGRVDAVEALVRWRHPQRGLLPPGEFIPVTEQTSMIRPMTIHLLEVALRQIKTWGGMGLDLKIAVNLPTQMLLDVGLPNEIQRMLARVGAASDKLELEITESAIVYDPRRAKLVLNGLHAMGLRIAIDDFGTGYSSLVSLRDLPVNAIKIDKSFVMGMEKDTNDAAIVRSTAMLGHNLGLEVVAEGVESAVAWRELAGMGCQYAQGFYLSRALDPLRFLAWLAAYREVNRAMVGGAPAHVEAPETAPPPARPLPARPRPAPSPA